VRQRLKAIPTAVPSTSSPAIMGHSVRRFARANGGAMLNGLYSGKAESNETIPSTHQRGYEERPRCIVAICC
jgi:hypothetical protein